MLYCTASLHSASQHFSDNKVESNLILISEKMTLYSILVNIMHLCQNVKDKAIQFLVPVYGSGKWVQREMIV